LRIKVFKTDYNITKDWNNIKVHKISRLLTKI